MHDHGVYRALAAIYNDDTHARVGNLRCGKAYYNWVTTVSKDLSDPVEDESDS